MSANYVGAVVANYTGATTTAVVLDPSTPTQGAAIADGDFLIATFTGAAGVAMTDPAGWTLVGKGTFGTRHGAVYYRIRQAGDGTYNFTIPSSNGAQATLVWWRGHDPLLDGLILGSWFIRPSALAYTDVPGVTPTKDGSTIITIGLEATTTAEADVSSVTFGSKVLFAPQTTTPQIHTSYLNELVQAGSAAATGTNRITYPNSVANGAGVMLALPPATGGPVPPVASFESVRTGRSVKFKDTSTSVGPAITGWAWDFGDGVGTSTSQNPTYVYGSSATFTVTLTTTNSDGSNQTTRQVVIPTPLESNVKGTTLYDDFSRYSNGSTPENFLLLTGQTWSLFSGPGVVTDGRYDSVPGTGASYLYVPTNAEVTRIGMTFRFDNNGGALTGNGPTALVMIWDDIVNVGDRNTRMHAVCWPAGVGIDTRRGGPNTLTRIANAAISPALAMNTDHEFEALLEGNRIRIYVDGILHIDQTDATFVDDSNQRQVVFEPYYNNDGSDPRVRTSQAWAQWGAVTPVTPAAGTSLSDLEVAWLRNESGITGLASLSDLRLSVYGASEHAWFAARSGLSFGSLADHKVAYYKAQTGATGTLTDLARAFFTQELA